MTTVHRIQTFELLDSHIVDKSQSQLILHRRQRPLQRRFHVNFVCFTVVDDVWLNCFCLTNQDFVQNDFIFSLPAYVANFVSIDFIFFSISSLKMRNNRCYCLRYSVRIHHVCCAFGIRIFDIH